MEPIAERVAMENLPSHVLDVFNKFFTAELTTVGRSGFPIAWPIMPLFWRERGTIVTLTSIGFPQKAFNIRRNRQVSLLFSNSTGSGMEKPPAVLVQGSAEAPDRIMVSRQAVSRELWEMVIRQARKALELQPAMRIYMNNPLTRYLMDWYFMRLIVEIRPERVTWWDGGDFSSRPHIVEVAHVE